MIAYHRGRLVAWCMLGLAVLGAATAAQEQPRSGSGDALLALNRAIDAYLKGTPESYTDAEKDLDALLKDPSAAEYYVACRYYLGLIALDRGLDKSAESSAASKRAAQAEADAKAATTPEDRQAKENKADEENKTFKTTAGAAHDYFRQARDFFEQIVGVPDPQSQVVSAALLLGIAQLAHAVPGMEEPKGERAVDLALKAEKTLLAYTQSEAGRSDRYGQFYLAAAQYRLADEYSTPPNGSPAKSAESVRHAQHSLAEAQRLADADHQADVLKDEGYEYFQTVITYYGGLLATIARDYPDARERFRKVRESKAAQKERALADNADEILNALDKAEAITPKPLQVPVPAPIGPFDLDVRLRIGNSYNSNVILLGKETNLPRGIKRKDDYQFETTADFNLSRYIGRAEAAWVGESLIVGMGGGTSNVWQPNIPQFDVNRYPARAYVNWEPIPDFYLGLQYEYSYTQLGHKPFISSQKVTPVLSKIWRVGPGTDKARREWGRTDLYFSHDDRNYLDRLSDRRLNRDGTYDALGVRQTFNLWQAREYLPAYFATRSDLEKEIFGSRWLDFYLGYEYRTERTVGTEFDLVGHSLVWGFNVPLPYRFAFELDGEFAWGDYTRPSIFDFSRKERLDFVQHYDFGLTYTFVARGESPSMRTLDVKLRAGIDLTFQNSNIWNRLGENIYEYDRAIYGVQLEVGF